MRVALVSHTNFLGNSAMHVFSIAEELGRLGCDVVVIVPDAPETVVRHRKPSFPILTYDQVWRADLPFRTGSRANLIHAWSPREHVRKVTVDLAKTHNCKYVVHMEDNEERIFADEFKAMSYGEIRQLPDSFLNAITDTQKSHPRRYRQFIEGAVGYTCLVDRLMEFKPKHIPGLIFHPGFDPEFEFPSEHNAASRLKYGIGEDEVVVFYGGNVHISIVEDVRNLYMAILLLRKRGRSIRLLRTGWNFASLDFCEPSEIREAIIDLGFVERAEMPGLLSLSSILVQPGIGDSFNDYRFPSKLPEYLVSGKPVILPDSNIGRCLCDGREAIKLYEGTLHELVKKIELVIDKPDLSAFIGRNGRVFALENLRWANAAKKVSEFYAQFVPSANGFRGRQACKFDNSSIRTEAPSSPVKLIAFYSSRFYFRDNNGGTLQSDWLSVYHAKKQFSVHKQPRRPTEFGYYDLNDAEIMKEQARLAQAYGIHGFCMFYYLGKAWQIDNWLSNVSEFPFCVCLVVEKRGGFLHRCRIEKFADSRRGRTFNNGVYAVYFAAFERQALYSHTWRAGSCRLWN